MPLLGIVDGVVLPALPGAIVSSRLAFSCDARIEILRAFFPQRRLPKDPHGAQVRWEVHWPRLKPTVPFCEFKRLHVKAARYLAPHPRL